MTDRNARRGPLAFLLDPVALQRLEGGMLLVLSVLLFWKYSGAWPLFALLILAPDVFMLGYLRGPRAGGTHTLASLFSGLQVAALSRVIAQAAEAARASTRGHWS